MATEKSVNEWLSLESALKRRLSSLQGMRNTASNRIHHYGEENRVEEPTYDVKKVDAMCVELENALFLISSSIKQSNAVTTVSLDIDYANLMRPIEE